MAENDEEDSFTTPTLAAVLLKKPHRVSKPSNQFYTELGMSQLHHYVTRNNMHEFRALHREAEPSAIFYISTIVCLYVIGLVLILVHYMNSSYGQWAWSLSDVWDELRPTRCGGSSKGDGAPKVSSSSAMDSPATKERLRDPLEGEVHRDSDSENFPHDISVCQQTQHAQGGKNKNLRYSLIKRLQNGCNRLLPNGQQGDQSGSTAKNVNAMSDCNSSSIDPSSSQRHTTNSNSVVSSLLSQSSSGARSDKKRRGETKSHDHDGTCHIEIVVDVNHTEEHNEAI